MADRNQSTTRSTSLKRLAHWRPWQYLAGSTLLIVVVGVGLWLINSKGTASPPATVSADTEKPAAAQVVEIVTVTSQRVESQTTYPGTIRANKTANLAFRVGGPLVAVDIAPGSEVKKGDVLMRIDPRDYENAVAAASATLESAKAKLAAMQKGARQEDVRSLEARLAAANARRQFAQAEYERNERLLKSNAVAMAEYDASKAELSAAEADLRAATEELQKGKVGSREEDVDAMQADIRALETQLKVARDQLADSSLRAPFDGMVTVQAVENYEQVAPGQTVLGMHNINLLEVDVSLPEREILHRQLDEAFDAIVRLVSLPNRTFVADFKEINTDADPTTRTYRVTFVMPKPEGINVFPGMVADITLVSATDASDSTALPLVPVPAVQSNAAGDHYVWVVQQGAAHKHPVKLGPLTDDNQYVVREGLTAGEQVVTSGAAFLHEGMKVVDRASVTSTQSTSPATN
ncbi:efflux RND transporter periplasmic adaptor subunit [Aeoliella mucimassa]|uniref:Multidrug resistance protein MdtA n=1 Tax=Aeoliella mucimassa TaxID=2527972 RepID=A0A518ARA7_9BACT|nr:efflux RND transporter periplasmic adaptor subunit [Aeoliella mucimassa]QDU57250.1 Multidrug resistance protein MdtA precursor [Aeoliella mucimassa]